MDERRIRIFSSSFWKGDRMKTIEAVKTAYEKHLLRKKGVIGVGIGETSTGERCIKVFVEKKADVEDIPETLEGYKVEIEEIGKVEAL